MNTGTINSISFNGIYLGPLTKTHEDKFIKPALANLNELGNEFDIYIRSSHKTTKNGKAKPTIEFLAKPVKIDRFETYAPIHLITDSRSATKKPAEQAIKYAKKATRLSYSGYSSYTDYLKKLSEYKK